MVDLQKYALGGITVVGLIVATVGADLVSSRRFALALVFGGSAVAWGSILLYERVAWGRCANDERYSKICYRSGFVSWFLLLSVLTTSLLSLGHLERPLPTDDVLVGLLAVSLVGYVGATAWYERTM